MKKSKFQWPSGKNLAVSLSFDDARYSQLDVGIPLLNKFNVKATFYVSPSRLKRRKKTWKKVLAQGHEIGNHSLEHPCSGNFAFARNNALEDYSLEKMEKDLEKANAVIEEWLGVRPKTFAYPCGQKYVGRGKNTRSYVPLVAEKFIAARGWRDENGNDPAFCDLAQLMGIELDGLNFEQALQWIENARKDGLWLIFAGHEVGEPNSQTTLAATLESLCLYATHPKNKIWIDTVENVAKYIIDFRKKHQIGFDEIE